MWPWMCAGVLSVLNLLIWHTGSSGAIPLGAFFSLVSLWFIISIPLCYSGAVISSATAGCVCHENAADCITQAAQSDTVHSDSVLHPWPPEEEVMR
jgi:Endomembrane protein 70